MKLKLRRSGLLFVTSLVTGFVALPLAASSQLSLLDPTLSQWETYLSYRHQEQYNGSQPTDAAGKPLAPFGVFPGLDPHAVFTLQQQGGETVLRVSGEIYGALTSKQTLSQLSSDAAIPLGREKMATSSAKAQRQRHFVSCQRAPRARVLPLLDVVAGISNHAGPYRRLLAASQFGN